MTFIVTLIMYVRSYQDSHRKQSRRVLSLDVGHQVSSYRQNGPRREENYPRDAVEAVRPPFACMDLMPFSTASL